MASDPSLAVLFPGQPDAPARLRAASLSSVALAVPAGVVSSAAVAERLGVSESWILTRTGVRERRVAASGERLVTLAASAGRRALDRAGTDAGELDLVLVATMAADELTPNAAPLVAHELGARRAGALDVGAACTGFLAALALASAQIECRRAERVLVVGADLLSRLTDPSDRATAPLFADGAGAALLGPAGDAGAIGPILLRADADRAGAIRADHDERLIRMQGHDTFREAVRRLVEATVEAAGSSGIELEEVDLFVFHQANARILAAVGERLGLPAERVIDCIDRYGNTSSATIPIALAEAEASGRLWPGATVLLAAFGAGFTWGAGVVRWG